MATLTQGSAALVLDSTGSTILGALMALQDIDLDALLASNPRLTDLAGQVVQFTPTYWLDWTARHPEFDWRSVFSTRLVAQASSGRLSKFVVVA
jgi:hypothetical protein